MTEKQEAIAMLKRARSRFRGPDSVVRNFEHIFEDANGAWIPHNYGVATFRSTGIVPDKMCVFGPLYLEPDSDVHRLASDTLSDAIPKDVSIMGESIIFLKDILHYYDLAIDALSKGESTV